MNTYAWLGIAVVVFAAEAAVYYAGGIGPRAELQQLKAGIAAAKKLHDAEDARKASESQRIIQEKDHERETLLADSGRAWARELGRVRAERDSLARAGSQPTPIVAAVCDGADGNQRLSDTLAQAERDTRAAIADYQAGVGELLVIAERQAASWDNLKATVQRIREVNR